MKRRHFLAQISLPLAAGLSGCAETLSSPNNNPYEQGQGQGQGGGAVAGGEFRAAWIATVYNLDWPSKTGLDAGTAKRELTGLIDSLHRTNFNAVVLQVRSSCDALYRSEIEPWTPWLTGTMGRNPGFDPLQHAIMECRRRGMELHAWFNPFRAMASPRFAASANHITRRRPDWVRRMGKKVWLDPALPEVRAYSLSVINDVVRRYDIDGVHFDDYFYPYPSGSQSFPDGVQFRASGARDIYDWRRSNVNTFVRQVNQSVHQIKPRIKFGISPFGIWRPGVPRGIEAQLDAYQTLAADAKLWLNQGWVDYMAPQLYWKDGGPQSFSALLAWWQSQNQRGRHLWPGLDITQGRGHSRAMIDRQIRFTRGIRGIPAPGQIYWAARNIRDNRAGIADMLRQTLYQNPAPMPAFPWLG